MNESFLDNLKDVAKQNILEAINKLKENIKSYVYFGKNLNSDGTREIGQFIIYLESVTPSNEYIPHFRELIDEFTTIIMPGVVSFPREKRRDLVLSLPFEVRMVLIKKLRKVIPVEEIEEMWDMGFEDFFGFKGLKAIGRDKGFDMYEQIKKNVQDDINYVQNELKVFEKELTTPYEEKIKEYEESAQRDRSYIERGEVSPYIIEEMKEFRRKEELERKKKEVVRLEPTKKIIEKAPERVLTEKKEEGIREVISKKPEVTAKKEVVRYDKVSDKIPKEKGVSVEGISLPKEEKEVKEVEKPVEAQKAPKEEVIKRVEPAKEAKPKEAKPKPEKVHYDSSEIIRKIKEEHKGEAGIDKKVE